MSDLIIAPPALEGNPFVHAETYDFDTEDEGEGAALSEPSSAACGYVPARGPQDPNNPFGIPPLAPDQLSEIEGSFWRATPELALIAKTAGEAAKSPWGLLAVLLANTATHVPYRVELPDENGFHPARVGDGGSLNLSVLPVGGSGEGKTSLVKLARRLLTPNGQIVTSGTSQGWVKRFVENQTVGRGEEKTVQRVRVAHELMVQVDEIDGLTSEFTRTGSKTSAAIRELLMGSMTGSATVDETRNNYLLPGSYRFVLVANAQAERLAPLFTQNEIAAGTPQRMLFAPVAFDGLRAGVNAIAAASLPKPPTWPVIPHANGMCATSLAGPVSSEGGQPAEELDLPVAIPWAPIAAREMEARARARTAVDSFFPTSGMTGDERDKYQGTVIRRHLRLTRF